MLLIGGGIGWWKGRETIGRGRAATADRQRERVEGERHPRARGRIDRREII